jgi:hypothetical protein
VNFSPAAPPNFTEVAEGVNARLNMKAMALFAQNLAELQYAQGLYVIGLKPLI